MKKKNLKILKIFIIVLLIFHSKSFARFYEKITDINIGFEIAEPVIEVEKDNMIVTNINNMHEIPNYIFKIKNYKTLENGKEIISEVPFEYEIEVINSNNSIPIKYEIFEKVSGEEILKGDLKSEKISMPINLKHEEIYEMVLSLKNKDAIEKNELENLDVRIKFNASQISEEQEKNFYDK